MKIEDNARSRMIIAVDILTECNKLGISKDLYKAEFTDRYNSRTGDSNGSEIFDLLMDSIVN